MNEKTKNLKPELYIYIQPVYIHIYTYIHTYMWQNISLVSQNYKFFKITEILHSKYYSEDYYNIKLRINIGKTNLFEFY